MDARELSEVSLRVEARATAPGYLDADPCSHPETWQSIVFWKRAMLPAGSPCLLPRKVCASFCRGARTASRGCSWPVYRPLTPSGGSLKRFALVATPRLWRTSAVVLRANVSRAVLFPQVPRSAAMKVKIKCWNGVATWLWVANDENCGICRMAFNGCCPDCKCLPLCSQKFGVPRQP